MSAYIISQTVFRHIFDRAGRVPVLALAKFGLISFPLIYAFAPNMTYLYIANFIVGVFSALNDTAVLSYLFDSTPSGQRGSYTSLYNLSVGLSYFLGSLVGGVLVSAGIPIFGFTASLQFVYLISAVGRGSIALMHKKLIETRKSETSLKAALMEELHLKSKNPKE
jgi:MFS family permease